MRLWESVTFQQMKKEREAQTHVFRRRGRLGLIVRRESFPFPLLVLLVLFALLFRRFLLHLDGSWSRCRTRDICGSTPRVGRRRLRRRRRRRRGSTRLVGSDCCSCCPRDFTDGSGGGGGRRRRRRRSRGLLLQLPHPLCSFRRELLAPLLLFGIEFGGCCAGVAAVGCVRVSVSERGREFCSCGGGSASG